MQKLTISRIAENLEILRAETRMLRIIVTGLVMNASAEAKDYAIALIQDAATAEPSFALNDTAEELARHHITRMASDWIALLSSQRDRAPDGAPPD